MAEVVVDMEEVPAERRWEVSEECGDVVEEKGYVVGSDLFIHMRV